MTNPISAQLRDPRWNGLGFYEKTAKAAADHIDAQDAKIAALEDSGSVRALCLQVARVTASLRKEEAKTKALVEAVKTGRDYVHDFSTGHVSFTDGLVLDMDMVADDLVKIDAALAAAKEPT